MYRCPRSDSRTRRQVWVEFTVASLLCSERFFSGFSGFLLSSKTNISKFQFDPGMYGHCQISYREGIGTSLSIVGLATIDPHIVIKCRPSAMTKLTMERMLVIVITQLISVLFITKSDTNQFLRLQYILSLFFDYQFKVKEILVNQSKSKQMQCS